MELVQGSMVLIRSIANVASFMVGRNDHGLDWLRKIDLLRKVPHCRQSKKGVVKQGCLLRNLTQCTIFGAIVQWDICRDDSSERKKYTN